MGRAKKKGAPGGGEFSLFDDSDAPEGGADEDLPRDEAGRAKIKHQYVDLLGIRVHKLAGRILNRERINKTLEGVYFICATCKQVCHNLDEGLVEDADGVGNVCTACHKRGGDGAVAAPKKSASAGRSEQAAPAKAASKASPGKPKTASKSSKTKRSK